MIKKYLLAVLSSLGSGAKFVPAFLQASPLGYQGNFRTVSGHTSVCMWNAACDMTEVEIAVSNAIVWVTGSSAEGIPSDNANLNIVANLYTPQYPYSKSTRNFSGSLLAGATDGTLAANAPASAWEYVEFSNGERRWVKYTGSSTAASWDTPLSSNCTNVARIWAMVNRGAFQFNGASPGVLTGGVKTVLKSIMSGLQLKSGDPVSINCYISKVGGGSFLLPANQPSNTNDVLGDALKECYVDSGTNYAANKFGTAPFNATLTGGVNQFRPIALRGRNTSNTLYLEWTLFGDSIASLQTSLWQKFFHKYKIPYLNLAKAGEYPSSFIAQNDVRKQVYGGRGALVEYGPNSPTLSQLQAMWAHARANGYTKVIQVLLPPNTSAGSTGWTASDQSDQVANPAIRTLNAQILALVGQPDGPDDTIDCNTPLVGPDLDKWKPNYTTDGTHLNNTAIQAGLDDFEANDVQAKFRA